MYNLFLDDIRDPSWVFNDNREWVIVRSFSEAIDYITNYGFPSFISFDHDLGPAEDKTGFDFAKWLVNQDLDGNQLPASFNFHVHSANPIGARNIKSLLDNYLTFRKSNP